MNLKVIALATLVISCIYLQSAAQTLDRNIFTTDGPVYSTIQSGDTLYVGGSFLQMGYNVKKFTRVTAANTKPDINIPLLDKDSYINAIEPDGNGGYYLGGSIFSYDGIHINPNGSGYAGVIHILSNYSLDPTFTPTNIGGFGKTVKSLKKKGNRLYVGGDFTAINGLDINTHLAALDPVSGQLLTNWIPEALNNPVDQIEATDSLVFICGQFDRLAQKFVPGFAALKTTDASYQRYFAADNHSTYWYHNVDAIKIYDNKLYLAGGFNNIGNTARGVASVSNATASQNLNFTQVDGVVYAVLPDDKGGYYLGGKFNIELPKGRYRHNLVHVLPDGSLDLSFDVYTNEAVTCITTDGTNLYIGGNFTLVNNSSRQYAAAVNRITGDVTFWNPLPNSIISTMVYSNGVIYIGGNFNYIKNKIRNHIAAVTTSNIITSWAPDVNDNVKQIVVNSNGSSVYLCGSFSAINNSTHPFVAKLDAATGLPAAWNPGPDAVVNTLTLNGSKLYMGGEFMYVNNIPRQYFAEVDTAFNIPTSFSIDANKPVTTLSSIDNKLYIGGYFTGLNNSNNYAARIDLSTKTVDSWNPDVNDNVQVIGGNGSNIIIGGSFTLANSVARKNIAAIDLTTNQLTAFNTNVPNLDVKVIRALHFINNELFAGGYFSYTNPDSTNLYESIIALDTTSGKVSRYFDYTLVEVWPVNTITSLNNKLYVGGNFRFLYDSARTKYVEKHNLITYNLVNNRLTSDAYDPNDNVTVMLKDNKGGILTGGNFTLVNYVSRQHLGAINLITGRATSWNPIANGGSVYTMALKDTTLFVGGDFDILGNGASMFGKSRHNLGAISTKTGWPTKWSVNANDRVLCMAIRDTILYVGGEFDKLKGSTRRNFVAALGTGGSGSIQPWNPNPSGAVQAILPVGNKVYLGGYFNNLKGGAKQHLAVVNNTDGTSESWAPNPDAAVFSLTTNGTTLYAGGMFNNISSQRRQSVAAFNLATNTLTAFNPKLSNKLGGTPLVITLGIYGKNLFIGSSEYPYYSMDNIAMDSINGKRRYLLGAADTATSNASAFNPGPNAPVNSITIGKSKLIMGGFYDSLKTSISAQYLSLFNLEPLTQATNLTFSNLQPNSVTASWNNGSGEGRMVIVKEGKKPTAPVDGTNYNADAAFAKGSGRSGGYVVYKGSGNNVNVTNLLPGHTYYFAVYEYNGTGSGTEYLQTPALTGSVTTPDMFTKSGNTLPDVTDANTTKTSNIAVYPNPASNKTTLEYTSSKSYTYTLQITDATGKVLFVKQGVSVAGKNIIPLDVSRFAQGMYLVSITDENGKQTIKLNKQ